MSIPKPPVLVLPVDGTITIDASPVFKWVVPDGDVGARYDFLLEIAEDKDFTKNVRKFNSFNSKEGFSFNTPREANSGEIVSFILPDPLVV